MNEITKALQTCRAPVSPFPDVSGRTDLRGIVLPVSLRICELRLTGADWSFAQIENPRVEHCWFVDCRWDFANLSDFGDHGNVFEDCSFEKTTLSGAAIGYEGSKYIRCRFEGADFRRAVFIRSEFTECQFTNGRLKGVDFNASAFEDCAFTGLIEDVWFRGGFALASDAETFGVPKKNRMKNVSFAGAELCMLTFSDGCDLSSVVLPQSGEYHLLSNWAERLRVLGERAQTWPEPTKKEAITFSEIALVHAARGQEWTILVPSDVEELAGSEAAPLILAELGPQ